MRYCPAEATSPSAIAIAQASQGAHTQPKGMTRVIAARPTTANHSKVVAVGSSPDIRRVSTTATAQVEEDPTTSSAAGWNASVPGRTITSTPRSPTTIAAQRAAFTTSRRITTDNAVISSGEMNPTDVASASGIVWMAKT